MHRHVLADLVSPRGRIGLRLQRELLWVQGLGGAFGLFHGDPICIVAESTPASSRAACGVCAAAPVAFDGKAVAGRPTSGNEKMPLAERGCRGIQNESRSPAEVCKESARLADPRRCDAPAHGLDQGRDR